MQDLNNLTEVDAKKGTYMSPESTSENVPAWLNSPPDKQFPALPVGTRLQTLPFGELTWENFERLIKRIVAREQSITDCWIYGIPGQKQFGLDILARVAQGPAEFVCYQCKRVKNYTAEDIKKAVNKFLDGKWAQKSGKLVLCVSSALSKTECVDEINIQIERLSASDIDFEVWDGAEGGMLAEKLKAWPDLVDDFFSREWVRQFNGESVADSLGERLQGLELNKLRLQLNDIYKTLFLRLDPGLRLGSQRPASLITRYISPVVIESRNIITSEVPAEENTYQQYADSAVDREAKPQQHTRAKSSSMQEIRISPGEWLSRHHRSVVLGEPGFGKSTLLRVIALQLLSASDEPIKTSWNNLLPVWISFGGFSSAVQTNPGMSLEDYFDNWLHQNAADDVRPLFRRAIKQSGLLLLVDGLDEGQDIDAAKQAMDRISAFLAIRSIPAIFTSRPRGYERVRPDGNWPVTRLGAFDKNQIEQFATMWFEYLESPDTQPGVRNAERVQHRTHDFLKATQVNSRIIELARTPLFCQLLIDIFRFSHRLPEQRVKVYEKIIDLLLSDHPSARSQAAGISGNMLPRSEDMHEMLMRLALNIHEEGGAGVISVEACQASFCSFLTDDLNGPGLSNYDAKHQAQKITDYALAGLGLMIERSPNELGFFHLTIQEYLAAQAMIRKEEEEQLTWLTRVWNLPQWHEVVLAWFSIRGMDQGKGATQRAVDRLKHSAKSPWESIQLLVLRTELAANDFGLSPREARATIELAAKEIETTPFQKIRLVLSGYLAQGLRSSSVSSICEHYITKWMPGRTKWERARLIHTLTRWKPSQDMLQALKLALHDEHFNCRWAAAESLAKLYSGDNELKEELIFKARKWPDLKVRAAALYCLWRGWEDDAVLEELAESASHSLSASLALTGILIKVSRRNIHDADRDKVSRMYFNRTIPYELEGLCCDLLVKGWGDDESLKKEVLERLISKQSHGVFETERFISFLVRAWSGDDDTSPHIVEYVNKYAIALIHNDELWQLIVSGFSGNKKFVDVIREMLKERKEKYNSLYWGKDAQKAYLAIGDEAAKSEVIAAYHNTTRTLDKYWICSTLMSGWAEDAEVHQLFSKEFLKPAGEAAILANWLHLFVHEKESRRTWLLEALNSEDEKGLQAVVSVLLDEFNDEMCINAVKALITNIKNRYIKIELKNNLIENAPEDPLVKEWVRCAFGEIDSVSISSIALSHEDDKLVRDKILNTISPMHSDARMEIFRVIREHLMPAESVMRITEHIFAEANPIIRTSGLIAKCIASQHDVTQLSLFQKMLVKEFKAPGVRYEMRQRSAFSAFLFMKDYDFCAGFLSQEHATSMHWLLDYLKEDALSARILFENWSELKGHSHLRNEDLKIGWSDFIHDGSARGGVIDDFTRVKLIECLKLMTIKEHSSQSLYLMAELLPGSAALRDCLIELMSQTGNLDNLSYEKAGIAQSIYAEQFSSDAEAYNQLADLWETFGLNKNVQTDSLFNVLYALAVGWPDSSLTKSFIKQVDQPKVPLHIALVLCGITGDASRAQRCIDAMCEEVLDEYHPFFSLYVEALRKWSYSEAADELLRSFLSDTTSSYFITALKLLGSGGRAKEDFHTQMVGCFNDQIGSHAAISEGVDIFNGRVSSVVQVIADEFMLTTG